MQHFEIIFYSTLISGIVSLLYGLIRDRNKQNLDIKRDEKITELQKQLTSYNTQHTRFFNEKVDTLKALHSRMSEFSSNVKTYLIHFDLPFDELPKDGQTMFWGSVENIRKKTEENIQCVGKIMSDIKLHIDIESIQLFDCFFFELTKLYGILATMPSDKNSKIQSIKKAKEIVYRTLPIIENNFNECIRSFFQKD